MSIYYRQYAGEGDLPAIMSLVQTELSEPYVIYTYRYFLDQWPHLAFLAFPESEPEQPSTHRADAQLGSSHSQSSSKPIGVIVCKQSMHREKANRGYIAMLSVNPQWRKRGIATALVSKSIAEMRAREVDEVVLETEFDNASAISLYESLGFIREKRLFRFYLNGKDAFRLILSLQPPAHMERTVIPRAERTESAQAVSDVHYSTGTIQEQDEDDDADVPVTAPSGWRMREGSASDDGEEPT
ncbi:acyl-CoA N-acyltransferase [Punctularia strigosozonata HHB-11173 SS5]|uniref:acyl-CoA N-acyltransferase n=1 Tax=Punctularia strigosozonata (strain HHB-11173) TaxID=741275 RepID=UPI0004416F1C|nr:acyl-CoA N-acyltransferase [Punctularia strigosozonata HHB-11173 SS5]EIN05827.1 acyl-CoA N-acyltransferase [Punctularia strigosozonata HHB-11173 SS5]